MIDIFQAVKHHNQIDKAHGPRPLVSVFLDDANHKATVLMQPSGCLSICLSVCLCVCLCVQLIFFRKLFRRLISYCLYLQTIFAQNF